MVENSIHGYVDSQLETWSQLDSQATLSQSMEHDQDSSHLNKLDNFMNKISPTQCKYELSALLCGCSTKIRGLDFPNLIIIF